MSENQGTDSTTIFDNQEPSGDNQTTTTQEPTTAAPSLPAELTEWVGEGKKYATAEDALKSIPHAQSYIDDMKTKVEELESEVSKRKTAAEVLEEFKSAQSQGQDNQTTPTIDTDQISKLVDERFTSLENAKVQNANVLRADSKMKETYGDKAKEVLSSKSVELSMSVDTLLNLAAKTPNAFLKLMDVGTSKPAPITKTNGSVNTEGFTHKTEPSKPKSIFNGASTADLTAAWRKSGEKLKQTNA